VKHNHNLHRFSRQGAKNLQPLSFEVIAQASAIPAMSQNVASSPVLIAVGVGALALAAIAFVVVKRMKGKRKASGMGM